MRHQIDHAANRANATGIEQLGDRGFIAGQHAHARGFAQEGQGVVEIAAAVLYPGQHGAVAAAQAAQHLRRHRHAGNLRDVVGGNAQGVVADAVDDGREGGFNAVRRDLAEIKRRQHHRLAHADRQHRLGDIDGVRNAGGAGAGGQLGGRDTGFHQRFGGGQALGATERWAFAGGAERYQPVAAVFQQPKPVADETGFVDPAIGI